MRRPCTGNGTLCLLVSLATPRNGLTATESLELPRPQPTLRHACPDAPPMFRQVLLCCRDCAVAGDVGALACATVPHGAVYDRVAVIDHVSGAHVTTTGMQFRLLWPERSDHVCKAVFMTDTNGPCSPRKREPTADCRVRVVSSSYWPSFRTVYTQCPSPERPFCPQAQDARSRLPEPSMCRHVCTPVSARNRTPRALVEGRDHHPLRSNSREYHVV